MAEQKRNKTVYKGLHVYAETDYAGSTLPEPVFVKVAENAGWYMSREQALQLADELVAAVNAVGPKAVLT